MSREKFLLFLGLTIITVAMLSPIAVITYCVNQNSLNYVIVDETGEHRVSQKEFEALTESSIEDYTSNLNASVNITADNNGEIVPVEYEVNYIPTGKDTQMLVENIDLRLDNKTDKNLVLNNIEIFGVGMWSEVTSEDVERVPCGSHVYAVSYEEVSDFEYRIHIKIPVQIGPFGSNICKIKFNFTDISKQETISVGEKQNNIYTNEDGCFSVNVPNEDLKDTYVIKADDWMK
jgi:hypothetical protein